MTKCVDAIVVGAGPAGLAMAAALKARGRNAIILEKSDMVVSVWRRHYDRLRLHTDRARSSLPRLPMPKASTPRVQAIEYFEAYAAKFALKPLFNAAVSPIREGRPAAAHRHRHARPDSRRQDQGARRRGEFHGDWGCVQAVASRVLRSSDSRNRIPP
jgi:phytoene dehydrogenase-like protein